MFVRQWWKQTEENLRKVIKLNREGNGANLRGSVARRVVTGGESAHVGASGEEWCVESEYGPSSSWESLSTAGVDERLDHGVRSPVFCDARLIHVRTGG